MFSIDSEISTEIISFSDTETLRRYLIAAIYKTFTDFKEFN